MKRMVMPLILQPFECKDIVRLGKNNDGGYLVNRADVEKSTKLISFGISNDWSFEDDFTKIKDCPVIGYDGSLTEDIPFFTGKNKLVKKNVGPGCLLSDILEPGDTNVFLKCDIEGGEYNLLIDIIKNCHRLSGITMEFHDLSNFAMFNQLTAFISKISQKLVHAHPNNWRYAKVAEDLFSPDVIEISFTSSPNIEFNPRLSLPHPLDMSNNPDDNNFVVTF